MVTLGEPSPTVLVLGAGFTRAFVKDSPLLFDDFGAKDIAGKIRELRHATRVLDAQTGGRSGWELDIERLMTRLDGRMPYDHQRGAESELAVLLTMLKKNFVNRITEARDEAFHNDDLAQLARCCVDNGINCVTFNYDDVLDQALREVRPVEGDIGFPYWHPDGGYGFFCKSSYSVVENTPLQMDKTAMVLLKLHGSVNWRTKLGAQQPYGLGDILHKESWMRRSPAEVAKLIPLIEPQLNPEPFMVPPVLVKSSLVEEPVLQYVWSRAYEILSEARCVTFVGYSFPVTDMAARFLFTETLLRDKQPPDIKVVNVATTKKKREAVLQHYREVFPRIATDRFDFRGAEEWSREFVDTFADEEQVSN